MKHIRSSFLLSGFMLLVTIIESAQAVPAFARQTQLECMACHAQNQTKLNSFGRDFARSAYTMSTESGAQSLIDGEKLGLGIPMVLNMSMMLKGRYDKSSGAINGKGLVLETTTGESIDSNRGIYEMFKTSTLNIAGRMSNNVGGIIEFREKEGKAILGGKVAVAFETGDGYTGFVVNSTNNYGPFSGIESYNTGLNKTLRQFENHKLTNAIQASDLGSGPATGVQLYYSGHNFFATLGAYVPAHNSDGIDIGGSMIPFARLAYEIPMNEMTLIIGAFGMNGTAKASNTSYYTGLIDSVNTPQALVGVTKESYGFDLQLEGTLQEMSTILTIAIVPQNRTTLSDPSLMVDEPAKIYGEPEDAEMQSYSIDLSLSPRPNWGVKMAFLSVNDTGPHYYLLDKIDVKDKDVVTLGFDYSFRQNIKLTMEYSMVEPKKDGIKNFTDLLSALTISF